MSFRLLWNDTLINPCLKKRLIIIPNTRTPYYTKTINIRWPHADDIGIHTGALHNRQSYLLIQTQTKKDVLLSKLMMIVSDEELHTQYSSQYSTRSLSLLKLDFVDCRKFEERIKLVHYFYI